MCLCSSEACDDQTHFLGPTDHNSHGMINLATLYKENWYPSITPIMHIYNNIINITTNYFKKYKKEDLKEI